jgi:hypothetical protein
MAPSEWIKLKSQGGDAVWVNLTNASTIEGYENGARIWFLAGATDSN